MFDVCAFKYLRRRKPKHYTYYEQINYYPVRLDDGGGSAGGSLRHEVDDGVYHHPYHHRLLVRRIGVKEKEGAAKTVEGRTAHV